MKQFVTLIFLFLTMLLYAGPASAKTFYLSDGASIKYQRVWKQGDMIYLLVNRDTLIDFAPDEVNQRKTLKAAGMKNFPRLIEKKSRPVRSHSPAAQKKPRPAVPPPGGTDVVEQRPIVFKDSLETDSGGGRTSSAQDKSGSAQGLNGELLAAYENLHNAMKSRNVEGVRQYLSSRRVSSLGEQEQAMIKAGVSLMPPNRSITGSSVSPDGTTATLNMTARVDRSSPPGTGTIIFMREEGVWKIDQENWEFQMN